MKRKEDKVNISKLSYSDLLALKTFVKEDIATIDRKYGLYLRKGKPDERLKAREKLTKLIININSRIYDILESEFTFEVK